MHMPVRSILCAICVCCGLLTGCKSTGSGGRDRTFDEDPISWLFEGDRSFSPPETAVVDTVRLDGTRAAVHPVGRSLYSSESGFLESTLDTISDPDPSRVYTGQIVWAPSSGTVLGSFEGWGVRERDLLAPPNPDIGVFDGTTFWALLNRGNSWKLYWDVTPYGLPGAPQEEYFPRWIEGPRQ